MRDLFISIISVIIAGAFAWAGSYSGPSFAGFPALMFIVGIGFLIHWIFFSVDIDNLIGLFQLWLHIFYSIELSTYIQLLGRVLGRQRKCAQ